MNDMGNYVSQGFLWKPPQYPPSLYKYTHIYLFFDFNFFLIVYIMKCNVCQANCRKLFNEVPLCCKHSPNAQTVDINRNEYNKSKYHSNPEYNQRKKELAKALYYKKKIANLDD